jgi:hypothetical protein
MKLVHLDNLVGIATGWTAEELRFDSRQGQEIFLFSVQTDSGAHPASCPVGTGGSFTRDIAAGA